MFEERVNVAEAVIHGGCKLNYFRCEVERIYPEINDSIMAYLLIFEVRDGGSCESIRSFDWVLPCKADVIEVCPQIVEVVQYLQKYKTHGLEVHGDRLWPFSRPGWYSEWVSSEVHRATGQDVVEVVKVSQHEGDCVLLAKSETGEKFYMKATIPKKTGEVFVARASNG